MSCQTPIILEKVREFILQKLKKVKIRDKSSLKNHRCSRCKELDGVCSRGTSELLIFHRKLNTESLKVDHDKEHKSGSHEIRDVGKILTIECFLESSNLVRSRDEKMKKSDDRALELGSSSGVDRGGRERFPDNCLTNVRAMNKQYPINP